MRSVQMAERLPAALISRRGKYFPVPAEKPGGTRKRHHKRLRNKMMHPADSHWQTTCSTGIA
jgi:hypothetical protein